METRDAKFYDLIAKTLGNTSFQDYVDTLFADKYDKPETKGFDWSPEMKDDFQFDQRFVTVNPYTLATFVDVGSHGMTKHTDGFQTATGKIPRMAHEFVMDEEIIRKQMLFVQRSGLFNDGVAASMERQLFLSVDRLIGGNYNTLKYMRHQAVSKASFDIIAQNNPNGISGISIDFNVPKKNKENAYWIKANGEEEANIDPIKFLQDKVREIRYNGGSVDHLEININTWYELIELTSVRTKLGYLFDPTTETDAAALSKGKLLDEDVVKNIIERKIKTKIDIIDCISVVEKWDATKREVSNTQLQAFEEGVIVFVPSEKIGEIQAVTPIIINDPAARIATYDGGRTVITQTFNAYEKVQKISSELTAIPVPEVVTQMYYVTIKRK